MRASFTWLTMGNLPVSLPVTPAYAMVARSKSPLDFNTKAGPPGQARHSNRVALGQGAQFKLLNFTRRCFWQGLKIYAGGTFEMGEPFPAEGNDFLFSRLFAWHGFDKCVWSFTPFFMGRSDDSGGRYGGMFVQFVVAPPRLDQPLCLGQGGEPADVQALGPRQQM